MYGTFVFTASPSRCDQDSGNPMECPQAYRELTLSPRTIAQDLVRPDVYTSGPNISQGPGRMLHS